MAETGNRPAYNYARLMHERVGRLELSASEKPPFVFKGVTTRVFPIRANMSRLRHFVNTYLNVPSLSGRHVFRPAMPFVYVMMLDYGRMAVEAANLGWVSQKEHTFTIPLEWYTREANGRLRFRDWSVVSPWIFVDNNLSLQTGREVYGWPKVLADLRELEPRWAVHPRQHDRRYCLETRLFPQAYEGRRQEVQPLIEVDYAPAPSLLEAPVDFTRYWSILGNPMQALQSGMDLVRKLAQMALGLPAFGHPLSMLGHRAQQMAQLPRYLDPRRRLSTHQITLKQFLDCESPSEFCYQALVDSEMTVRRLNGGGLLGDPFLRRMDPTGGYALKIHEFDAQPIVDSLGLEVDRTEEVRGHEVSVLHPLFPFWIDVDLDYGPGRVVDEATKRPVQRREGEDPDAVQSRRPDTIRQEVPVPTHGSSAYSTARGAAGQAIGGPFEFPDVTTRVLPLLADPARLAAFCADYLDNPYYTFQPWGRHVYLVASNYKGMTSLSNDVGLWADREVEFLVPVLWRAKKKFEGLQKAQADRGEVLERPDSGELWSVALVPAYAFVNTSTAAITGREVNGRPALYAEIDAPDDVWMSTGGPTGKRSYLDLRTHVFPAPRLGHKAEARRLLEVREGPCPSTNDATHDAWLAAVQDAYLDEQKALALNSGSAFHLQNFMRGLLFDGQLPGDNDADRDPGERAAFNFITLKQFRDATLPDRACFQSLVHYQKRITQVHDVGSIPPVSEIGPGADPVAPPELPPAPPPQHTPPAGVKYSETQQSAQVTDSGRQELPEPPEGQKAIHVVLDRYDWLPIREVLGLIPKFKRGEDGRYREYFEPQDPFWLRVKLEQSLGRDLLVCGESGVHREERYVRSDFAIPSWPDPGGTM